MAFSAVNWRRLWRQYWPMTNLLGRCKWAAARDQRAGQHRRRASLEAINLGSLRALCGHSLLLCALRQLGVLCPFERRSEPLLDCDLGWRNKDLNKKCKESATSTTYRNVFARSTSEQAPSECLLNSQIRVKRDTEDSHQQICARQCCSVQGRA